LAAMLRRAGLVDKGNPSIEKSLLAGDPRKNCVRDDVGDAARIIWIGDILAASDLRTAGDVPEPKLGLQPAVGSMTDTAGHHELRIDHAPRIHLRHLVWVADNLDETLGVDGRQKHGALEVIGNNSG